MKNFIKLPFTIIEYILILAVYAQLFLNDNENMKKNMMIALFLNRKSDSIFYKIINIIVCLKVLNLVDKPKKVFNKDTWDQLQIAWKQLKEIATGNK
jgi:hypothetical protein